MTPKEQCEKFNAAYPAGTNVFLRKDNGTLVSTKTRSTAELLNDREAVIWLEGIGGCYLLDRVTPFDQVLRLAGRRTMDPMTNALQMTGCQTEEDLIDMANVGQSLMARIGDLVKCEGPFKNWSPADDPAEIVGDLYSVIEDKIPHWSQATIDVFTERYRQIEKEDHQPVDDDNYRDGELAWAAACYAVCGLPYNPASAVLSQTDLAHALWPWELASFNPKDRRRDLVRAAALAIAEIERLDRVEQTNG